MQLNSMYQYIDYIEKQYADRVAFRWHDQRESKLYEKTYKEYVRDVRNCATKLIHGFPNMKKRHIGILAANSYAYIVAYMGVILAQGVAVLLNPNERLEVLKDEIELAELDLLLTDGGYQAREAAFDTVVKTPTASLLSVLEPCIEPYAIPEDADRLDELAILIFTSGTTGKNKGVELSLRNVFAMVRYYIRLHERVLAYLCMDGLAVFDLMPYYHVAGINTPLAFNFFGTSVYIGSGLKYLYRDLRESHATYIPVPPIVINDFYAAIMRGNREKLADLKLIITGGATINHEILEAFARVGILVLVGYGMTETNGIGTISVVGETNEYKRLHSVGTAEEECRVSIRDGEVCFKGDAVTRGYYKDPVATAEAFDEDGWFHSGDMGYLDDEGYLFLTGRKKNLIILASGESVSPEELENLLLENASIKEVLVKEKNGKICGEVYCDEERREEVEVFIRQFNKSLPFYKQIVLTEYRTTPFERTAIGKIKRRQNGD